MPHKLNESKTFKWHSGGHMDVSYKFNSGRLFTANDWYKNKLKVNKTTLNLLEGKIKKQIKIMSLSLTLSTISPTGTAQKINFPIKDFFSKCAV